MTSLLQISVIVVTVAAVVVVNAGLAVVTLDSGNLGSTWQRADWDVDRGRLSNSWKLKWTRRITTTVETKLKATATTQSREKEAELLLFWLSQKQMNLFISHSILCLFNAIYPLTSTYCCKISRHWRKVSALCLQMQFLYCKLKQLTPPPCYISQALSKLKECRISSLSGWGLKLVLFCQLTVTHKGV